MVSDILRPTAVGIGISPRLPPVLIIATCNKKESCTKRTALENVHQGTYLNSLAPRGIVKEIVKRKPNRVQVSELLTRLTIT